MRSFALTTAVLLLIATGCATHYHRARPDGVHFFLRVAHAGRVEMARSGSVFGIYEAQRVGSELWSVTVPSGEAFRYFYLVDGKSYLPDCPLREADDFGSQNCIFQPERQGGDPSL